MQILLFGPMQRRSYEIPLVCLVVGWSGEFLQNSWDGVGVSSKLKSDRARFKKKILFLVYGAKGPKTCMQWGFLSLIKINTWDFSDFLYWSLKVDLNDFFCVCKTSCIEVSRARGAKRGPMKNWHTVHKVTVAHKLKIDPKDIFLGKNCFLVVGPICPKWGFKVLSKVSTWNIFYSLHEVTSV